MSQPRLDPWLDLIEPVMNTGHMRTMSATEFKARCLAVLDDVRRTGRRVTILKRGKAVAELGPVGSHHGGCPQDALLGTVTIHGDIVGPCLAPIGKAR